MGIIWGVKECVPQLARCQETDVVRMTMRMMVWRDHGDERRG